MKSSALLLFGFLSFGMAWLNQHANAEESNSVIAVVLDDSGSMRQNMARSRSASSRMQAAKAALAQVIEQLPPETQLGIFTLNRNRRGDHWIIPIAPIDKASAIAQIEGLRADGGTPLGASLKSAADNLLSIRERLVYGDFRLLVITDGEATDRELLDAYLPDLLARGLTLDVIGVDMLDEHSLANRSHSYRRADDEASFAEAITAVFAESSDAVSGASGATQDDDFTIIAGLPDDSSVGEVLAALAIPDNRELGQTPASVASIENSSGLVNSPTPPSNTIDLGPVGAVFAMLPCCLSLLIGFAVMVMFFQSLGGKKRR